MYALNNIKEFTCIETAIENGIKVSIGKSSCKRGGYQYTCPAAYVAVSRKDGTATFRMVERFEEKAHTYKADHLTDIEIERLAGELGCAYVLHNLQNKPA